MRVDGFRALGEHILIAPLDDQDQVSTQSGLVLQLGRTVKKPVGIVTMLGPQAEAKAKAAGFTYGDVVLYDRDLSDEYPMGGDAFGKGDDKGLLLSKARLKDVIAVFPVGTDEHVELSTRAGLWCGRVSVQRGEVPGQRIVTVQEAA